MKSTPPQHRRLIILIRGSKQQVDDVMGELNFQDHLIIKTLCEIKVDESAAHLREPLSPALEAIG